ncbi:S41 family peptidase [Niabella aquatica]
MNVRFFWVTMLSVIFISCEKNDTVDTPDISASGTRLEQSLDSLYLYARETYLWYQALPDYNSFHPQGYADAGDDLTALQKELSAIAALAINPQTGKSYEFRQGYEQLLYSYIAKGNIFTGRSASVDIEGRGNDMGLDMAIIAGNEVYVKYVETGSPAAEAGIVRGMKVMGIDGVDRMLNSSNISAALAGAEAGITLQKPDGTNMHVTLQKKIYTASPVLKSAVINAGGIKAGYIALSRFSSLANGKSFIDAVFNQLSGENITGLIVDLRYNNGGYIETAEYVADLIAPASINGSVMYAEHFNELLQQSKAPILKTIPYLDDQGNPVFINGRTATYADVDFSVSGNTYRFSKKGALTGIQRIVFIVSGITASAGELLINCFKPYVDVKLVGSDTYGKPVGSFGIGIDGYTAHLAQFRILNAAGEGDYYNGIPADIAAADDVTKDFGSPLEECVAKALAALTYQDGSKKRLLNKSEKMDAASEKPLVDKLMLEHRLRLR